jgi:hypothetical protein
MDKNREIGIILKNSNTIKKIINTFEKDFYDKP